MFEFFDKTTIAVSVPSMFLSGLIFHAAYQKKIYPWTTGTATLEGLNGLLRDFFVALAISTIAFNLFLASGLFALAPGRISYVELFYHLLFILCLSLIPAGLVFTFFSLVRFGKSSISQNQIGMMRSRYFFSILICIAFLIVSTPVMQALLAALSLNEIPLHAVWDLFRIGIALTTIPMSLAAVPIALYHSPDSFLYRGTLSSYRRTMKMLKDPAFQVSQVSNYSDEQLQSLLKIAIATKNLDSADKISHYLLVRATSDTYMLSEPISPA